MKAALPRTEVASGLAPPHATIRRLRPVATIDRRKPSGSRLKFGFAVLLHYVERNGADLHPAFRRIFLGRDRVGAPKSDRPGLPGVTGLVGLGVTGVAAQDEVDGGARGKARPAHDESLASCRWVRRHRHRHSWRRGVRTSAVALAATRRVRR